MPNLNEEGIGLTPIGTVSSPLTDLAAAPKQGDEGAPDRVKIVSVEGNRLRVSDLEAVDGTPIVDVKPMLRGDIGER